MAEHTHALRRGALTTPQLVALGLANMAPAIASFFVLGPITAAAGAGTPLVVLIAGVGYALHVNSTAEFSRVTPSAGFYVTFLGRSFGSWAGAMGAAVYTLAQFTVGLALCFQVGVWTSLSASALAGVSLPWWIPTLAVETFVALAITRGIRMSARVVVMMLGFDLAVLAAGAIAIVIRSRAAISGAGFLPGSVSGGMSGLGMAFPLAIFLFRGASNPAPFAEETSRPHDTLPRAVFATVALAMVIYTSIAWAEGIGLASNMTQLTGTAFPFIAGASRALPLLGDLMYVAGFTSAVGVLLAAGSVVNRVWFSMAREGLLPRWLGVTHPRYRTPARMATVSLGLMMAVTVALGALTGPDAGFSLTAALGTIGTVVLFIVVNFALTAYFWRRERARFRVGRHLAAPLLGTVAFAWPLWQTVRPGQAWPYNWFGALWAALLVLAAIYATVAVRRGATPGRSLTAEPAVAPGGAAPAPTQPLAGSP